MHNTDFRELTYFMPNLAYAYYYAPIHLITKAWYRWHFPLIDADSLIYNFVKLYTRRILISEYG